MAVSGITNHIERFPEQLPGQNQGSQPVASTLPLGDGAKPAVAEDTFTSSTQGNFATGTAQDAGIFQVSQGAATTAPTSNPVLLANPNTNQNGASSPQAASAATASAGNTQTAEQTNPGAPGTKQSGATPSAQTTANPIARANVQNQIQALNAALPALGLTNEEIQQIDRIASLVGNFNPAAYASLVSQFEALAQQAAQQGAPSPGPAGVSGLTAAANTNGGNFQVQGVSIHLTVPIGSANNPAGNGGALGISSNNSLDSANGLQIAQVQFTLSNSNGQTVQVQLPQTSTAAGISNPKTTQSPAAAGG